MFELPENDRHGSPPEDDYKVERPRSHEAIAWQELTQAILAAIEQGNESRAGRLFGDLQARSESVLLVVASRNLSADDADDVVATAFLTFYDRLRNGKAVVNAKALLEKIVRNLAADHYRSKYVRHEQTRADGFWQDDAHLSNDRAAGRSEILGDPLIIAVDLDRNRIVNAVLDELPDHYRKVLEARIYDDLSVIDTMRLLGLTEDQVKKYTSRGLRALGEIAKKRGLNDRT